jgi:hypothetical protein
MDSQKEELMKEELMETQPQTAAERSPRQLLKETEDSSKSETEPNSRKEKRLTEPF